MIARLSGRCIQIDSDSIVVDVGGVGYFVRATSSVIQAVQHDPDNVIVHVHTNVRDDAIQLFGFSSYLERTIFERLIALQGVGPRVAISVLSSVNPQDIQRATMTDDFALLQSVQGVGPKVARRIVTELKDKLNDLFVSETTTFSAHVISTSEDSFSTFYEAREALVGLGMTLSEAENALSQTDESATTSERIKKALANRKQVRT